MGGASKGAAAPPCALALPPSKMHQTNLALKLV